MPRWTTVATALAAVLTGCASAPADPAAPGPPTQSVRIETPWCPGARCTAANDLGAWTLAASPGTLALRPSAQRLTVTCTAPGAGGAPASPASPASPDLTAVAQVASTLQLPEGRPATRAGAAIGAGTGLTAGLLGAGLMSGPAAPLVIVLMGAGMGYYGGAVGAAVDHSQRTPRYPDSVVVPLACPTAP